MIFSLVAIDKEKFQYELSTDCIWHKMKHWTTDAAAVGDGTWNLTRAGHDEPIPGYTFTDGTTAENLVPFDHR